MSETQARNCRCCGLSLVIGSNWAPSRVRRRDYICGTCGNEAMRKRRKVNPEASRATNRKANRKWRKANPEAARETCRIDNAKRRALKAGVAVGDTAAIRHLEAHRWAAEGFAGCSIHIDHITPLSRGGAHSASNLRYLPARLNLVKGDKLDSEVSDPEFRAWVDTGPRVEQVSYVTRRTPRGKP